MVLACLLDCRIVAGSLTSGYAFWHVTIDSQLHPRLHTQPSLADFGQFFLVFVGFYFCGKLLILVLFRTYYTVYGPLHSAAFLGL